MKHPELKAALIEALRHTKSLEEAADAVLAAFTPTREQVLRWEGLPDLLDSYFLALTKVFPNKWSGREWVDMELSALTPEPGSLIGRKVDKPRFFVDERAGCIAVRDRLHPRYDPSYQGLHSDTVDVIFYAHGSNVDSGWEIDERDKLKANSVCDHLNSLFPDSQIHAHLVDEPTPQTYPLKTAVGPVLTEEMAVRVCKKLHEMGKKWQASGRSYRDTTNWDSRREETCYSINEGEFSNLAYYQCLNGYTLITPEEFLGVEAEASVKPVILQCQDGPCYDKNHLVHWISNYETGALDTYYAWAYIEEGCKEPCFLTQSACQAYLDSLLIGYECPEDLYGGDVRKGDLYTLTINSASCLPKGKSFWVYAMPYEIVKCWKKVYRKPSPEQPNG